MKPELARSPASHASAILSVGLLWSFPALGVGAQEATVAPPSRALQEAVSPDARRFPAGPLLAYWSGTERILDGELSPAAPRQFARGMLLPGLDDAPKTTAFMRAAASRGRSGLDWQVLELGSMHEIQGGAVLSVNFRVDEREQRAEQGIVALSLPVEDLWLAPIVGFGAESDWAPTLVVGNELRSSRQSRYGYSLGFETSRWTHHRNRTVGKLAGVYRVGPRVALEERVAIGAWSGPRIDEHLALQWTSAALQSLSESTTLYERVTLARSIAGPRDGDSLQVLAWSVDTACSLRYAFSSTYAAVITADLGSQPSRYRRVGAELTLYGTLF